MASSSKLPWTWTRLGPAGWGFALATVICPGFGAYVSWPRWGLVLLGIGLFRSRLDQVDPACLWLLAGGLALAAASLLWAPDLMTGLGDLLQLAGLGAVLILATSWRRQNQEMALLGLVWGLAVSAGLVGLELAGLTLALQETSWAGLFGNREWLAELAAPMVVWLLASKRIGLGALLAAALLVTGSRLGLLAVVVGLAWWLAAGRVWILALLTGLVLALGLALLTTGNGLPSIAGRMNGWLLAWQLADWNGLGLGFFRAAWPFQQVVHSDLLQFAAELGFGLVPFVALFALLVWRNLDDLAWSPAGAAFIAIIFESALSFPLHTPAGGWLAAVLAGSLAGARPLVLVCQFRIRIIDEPSPSQFRPTNGALVHR